MSRVASAERVALLDMLTKGFSGTYETLASVAGVKPKVARATLKELSRAGHACATRRQRVDGRPGASPAVYAAHQRPVDALGFALQVWR